MGNDDGRPKRLQVPDHVSKQKEKWKTTNNINQVLVLYIEMSTFKSSPQVNLFGTKQLFMLEENNSTRKMTTG